jgi:hypothetical protein
MNSIKSSVLLVLSSIIVLIGFSACSNDDIEVIPTPDTSSPNPVANVRVVESGFVSTQVSLKAANPANMAEFQREDFVITPLTEEEAKSKALQTGESGEDGSTFCVYKWVTLLYRCKTADGTEKDLSELIVWPYALIGEATPSQLVIGCHSTITSDAQRPTNFSNLSSLGEINMLALFTSALSQKALVIVPDYEGYGSTASYPHPYCNRELTAEQVVTGVKAGLSWFESEVSSMDEDWSAVSIGYSQGGAVSAGVLRYCQDHNETSLRLKGAVCGDGPYDPLATLKRYITMDQLFMPVAPAMLLKGAIDTDPDMMAAGCKYQDFVTDEFKETGIFDMIGSKQNTTDDIQAALLQHSFDFGDDGGFVMKAKTSEGFLPYTKKNSVDGSGKQRDFELENGKGYNYCTVDQCLKPGVIAYFRDGIVTGEVPEAKLKALEHSLAKNAVTADNFMPGRGFTFFHSIGDEVVPYCNFESVRSSWGIDNIKAVTYQSGSLHVATGTDFFLKYCGSLVNEILKDTWTPCEKVID